VEIFKYNNRHINDKGEDLLRFVVDGNILELGKYPNVKQLHITGLKQVDFSIFIDNFADQYDFIYFFKCPSINDLSRLSELKNIKYISFFWNNMATELWDMSGNDSLKGIYINDFKKLHNISILGTAHSLEEFHLNGGMYKNAEIEDLKPLSNLINLNCLSLMDVNVKDDDLTPLFSLKKLKILRLTECTYPVEVYAKLAAKLPETSCECFKGYVNQTFDEEKDIQIVGKRKPALNSKKNKDRLEKYISNFDELVSKYEAGYNNSVELNADQR
jgi:hypothetical protein